MKEGQKNYRTTPTRAKGDRRDLREKNRKIGNPYGETWERRIATTQPDETSLIYRTVPTCAYIVSIFYLPVPGREIFWIERMKPVPAYRQPCFLPTPPTPDGDIYLAAPEPATAASTPLLQISHTILLAGLYTNKSNSFYSKSHMYRVRRKSPNSWFVIDILHVPMSACNSSWT